MKRTYSHIDMDERRKIARWRTAGLTVDIIAEKLGRHRSTIFREIRRNMFIDDAISNLNGYYCVTAHDMACERRTKLRKLMRFSHVRQSVIDRIMHDLTAKRSSCGGTCRSIELGGHRDMPDASMANGLVRNSTSCAARMWSPIASSSGIGSVT